jgi:hypothetical protein
VPGSQVSPGWRTGYDKLGTGTWCFPLDRHDFLGSSAADRDLVRDPPAAAGQRHLRFLGGGHYPLAQGDKLVFARLASMERRRPEMKVTSSFTSEADEDPL